MTLGKITLFYSTPSNDVRQKCIQNLFCKEKVAIQKQYSKRSATRCYESILMLQYKLIVQYFQLQADKHLPSKSDVAPTVSKSSTDTATKKRKIVIVNAKEYVTKTEDVQKDSSGSSNRNKDLL